MFPRGSILLTFAAMCTLFYTYSTLPMFLQALERHPECTGSCTHRDWLFFGQLGLSVSCLGTYGQDETCLKRPALELIGNHSTSWATGAPKRNSSFMLLQFSPSKRSHRNNYGYTIYTAFSIYWFYIFLFPQFLLFSEKSLCDKWSPEMVSRHFSTYWLFWHHCSLPTFNDSASDSAGW